MNPEFRRQLWLNWSPARVVAAPVLLGLALLLALVLDKQEPLEAIRYTFTIISGAVLGIWATMAVSQSLLDEVHQRTWEQQRLSSLEPWPMAWGKLLGSASYAWYAGLLSTAVLAYTATGLDQPGAFLTQVLATLLLALSLHASVLALQLFITPERASDSAATSGRGRHMGPVMLVFLLLGVMNLLVSVSAWQWDDKPRTGWWGLQLSVTQDMLLIALALLPLSLLALWRSMSVQLMVRTLPWAWPLGCLALASLAAGYAPTLGLSSWLLTLGIFSLAACVLALLGESNSRLRWHTVHWHARQGNALRSLQALPLWPISWLLAAAAAVWLCLRPDGGNTGSLLLLAALHLLRDVGIYLWFNWAPRRRAPLALTLLTLFVLGSVLPAIVASAISPQLALWIDPLLFWLDWVEDSGNNAPARGLVSNASWVAMALHLAAMAALLAWRWRQTAQSQSA